MEQHKRWALSLAISLPFWQQTRVHALERETRICTVPHKREKSPFFLQYLLCDNTTRLQIICRISTEQGFCQQEMENLGLLFHVETWQIIQNTRINYPAWDLDVVFSHNSTKQLQMPVQSWHWLQKNLTNNIATVCLDPNYKKVYLVTRRSHFFCKQLVYTPQLEYESVGIYSTNH